MAVIDDASVEALDARFEEVYAELSEYQREELDSFLRDECQEDERATFQRMYARFTPGGHSSVRAEHASWLSLRCLRRFLRARDWKLDKASSMLASTLAWRDEVGLTATPMPMNDTMRKIASQGGVYVVPNAKDRAGRPLFVLRPQAGCPVQDVEWRVKFLVYQIETAKAMMGEEVEKVTLIIDWSLFTTRGKDPASWEVAKKSVQILQNHYPELLSKAFLVHTPWWLSPLIKMFKVFLHANTVAKINIVSSGSAESIRQAFDAYVAPDNLQQRYGGTMDDLTDEEIVAIAVGDIPAHLQAPVHPGISVGDLASRAVAQMPERSMTRHSSIASTSNDSEMSSQGSTDEAAVTASDFAEAGPRAQPVAVP